MKKFFFILAAATALVACNQNKPVTPEEQKKADFAKAHYFEVLGTNTVPSENYTQDSVVAYAYVQDDEVIIDLYGVGFSARMPLTIDMTIENINYTRTAERITLSGDNIVPMMGEKPFDRYLITGLNGYITPDSLVINNAYGSFVGCKYAGKITKMEESSTDFDE